MNVNGACVSTNPRVPYVAIIDGPTWDVDGYQIATRINGSFVCPRCGLAWPLYEDVEAWVAGPRGRWYASEWGLGHGICELCEIGVHKGFDEDYVIDFGKAAKAGGE